MNGECGTFFLWIDWEARIASFHESAGFEPLLFCSRESYQANIRILVQSGFRFQ